MYGRLHRFLRKIKNDHEVDLSNISCKNLERMIKWLEKTIEYHEEKLTYLHELFNMVTEEHESRCAEDETGT